MLPSYQSPITLSPPLQPQLDACCILTHRQQIIHSAALHSSNQLWIEPYQYADSNMNNAKSYNNINIMNAVSIDIERIILQYEGSISGIQYDRYGALWISGVELLRTTTPEPTGVENETISWTVTKDVTEYASLLLSEQQDDKKEEVYAAVSIPNTVNKEYTGVIHVNCTLSFYTSKKSAISNSSLISETSSSTKQTKQQNRQKRRPSVMNLNTNFNKIIYIRMQHLHGHYFPQQPILCKTIQSNEMIYH